MKAYLYTWGEGRNTAEGEHIPVRIESLDIGYIDGQLLLPLIEEHTIDERSPLCGHTYMSLKAVSSCSDPYGCKMLAAVRLSSHSSLASDTLNFSSPESVQQTVALAMTAEQRQHTHRHLRSSGECRDCGDL